MHFKPSKSRLTSTKIDKELLTSDVMIPVNKYTFGNYIVGPKLYQPSDVISILQSNVYLQKWDLYNSAEIYWARIQKNISFLKKVISSKKYVLKPFEPIDAEKAADRENTGYGDSIIKYDLVNEAIKNFRGDVINNFNTWQDFLNDIVDAYGKGISLQELQWQDYGDYLLPKSSRLVHAQGYKFDVDNKITLSTGGELDPNKFVLSIYRNRSTNNRSTFGVYQPLMWLYCARSFINDFWVQSIEKFGQPYRHATYPTGASKELKDSIAYALQNFGASSYGVFPEKSNLQLLSANAIGDGNAHKMFLDQCDVQADLVMLGQNLTSEINEKGSRAAAEVHAEKEDLIISTITKFVLEIINTQFIPAILRVNGFDLENAPIYTVEDSFDLEEFNKKLDVITKLKNIGMNVDVSNLIEEAERYGIVLKETIQPETSGSVETPKPNKE
jgi:hypothetical protein